MQQGTMDIYKTNTIRKKQKLFAQNYFEVIKIQVYYLSIYTIKELSNKIEACYLPSY